MRIHQIRHAGRLLLLAVACFALMPLLRGAEAHRTAVLDFVRADSPGSLDPALLDFSRVVQAHLLTDDTVVWVERQEFDQIMHEADPGNARGFDAATAVRLGRLLRADLMLRGEVAQRPPGSAELTVEVIDLHRAEVLAARTVPVTMSARQRFHPTAAETSACKMAAQDALTEARRRLRQAAPQQVLAPLYFRNTSLTDRLGFLEGRLQAALVNAATPATGVRVLQFPRAGEAGEEASLVLSGLTDTDPDAWQKVADVYVWGSFQEEPIDGMIFDDVPVKVVLQISNGASAPQEVQWSGTVKTLPEGIELLSGQVIAAARTLVASGGPAQPDARRRIAADLQKRAAEIGRQIAQGGPQFPASIAGQLLFTYRMKLLEVACFFDPLNSALQQERLKTVWSDQNPFKPLESLRGQWLRIADYRTQAERFSRDAKGRLDGQWPGARARHLEHFIHMLGQSDWRSRNPQVSVEELHRQERLVVNQWSELLVETQQAVLKEPELPRWYARQVREWLTAAEFLLGMSDPIIVQAAIEKIWPVLELDFGRLLRTSPRGKDAKAVRWIERLFSVYERLSDHDRAIALLDSAWKAGAVDQSSQSNQPRQRNTQPAPPRVDQPWVGRSDQQTPPANPAVPFLPATIRELELRTVRTFRRTQAVQDPVLKKETNARYSALAWQGERLWVFESNEPLPSALGPPNLQGDHYLWCYDPALRSTDLVTSKLGAHATVQSLVPTSDALWLGLAGDGVWTLGPAETVRRYKGEDGLQTMQIHSATADARELFFLGGNAAKPLISVYSRKAEKWSGLQVPQPTPLPQRLMNLPENASGPKSGQLAVSGEWLCFSGLWTAFYNRTTGQWVDFQLTSDPIGGFRGRYQLISGDEKGFWCAQTFPEAAVIWFIDPARPQEKQQIKLPKLIPRALAHEGAQLWVLMEDDIGQSLLVLVDKKTRACIGQIVLPMHNAESLTVGDGHAWIGRGIPSLKNGTPASGFALVEVTLPRLGTDESEEAERPQKFPLQRAVWKGDPRALAAALAGKPDPDATDANGWTALMGAVASGRSDLARLLLAAGANPNLLSRAGDSALQQAAIRGDVESARLLLQHGAQVNLRLPVWLRGLSRPTRPLLEPLSTGPNVNNLPQQPTNLRATVSDGKVSLNWEDRADNETHYVVLYQNAHGGQVTLAQLPADSTQWSTYPDERNDAELIYQVLAVNSRAGMDPRPKLSEVRIRRPLLPELSFRFEYLTGPLPIAFMAQTPLGAAVSAGQADMVSVLLEAGADPNMTDATGYTPLMQAVRARHYAIARRLLAGGAKPELIAETGDSAAVLTYLWHEDQPLLEELLRTTPVGEREREALWLIGEAAARGQIKDIETLQTLGGNLGERLVHGDDPIRRALDKKQIETAHWMVARRAPDLRLRFSSGALRDSENQILEAAMAADDSELVGQLLDLGLSVDYYAGRKKVQRQPGAAQADPAVKNEHSNGTPLAVLAAKKKAFAVLTLLRDRGANLSLKDELINFGDRGDGTVASHLTPEEVRLYLNPATIEAPEGTWPLPMQGTLMFPGPVRYINQADPTKLEVNTILVTACQKGDLPAAMRAVAAGAQLDCNNAEGRTPLLEALRANAFDLVRWLVEEGASVNLPSKRGFSPVSFALDTSKPSEMLNYLLQAGGDPNCFAHGGAPPLVMAVSANKPDAIQQLLDAGANPNVSADPPRGGQRMNALAVALRKGNAKVVDLLLANGANPLGQTYAFVGYTEVKGGVYKSPRPSLLMFAAAGGNVELVKRMISFGQNPKLKIGDRYDVSSSGDGYDALSWAASEGAQEVVKYLLPLSDQRGWAIVNARGKGHEEVVRILESAGYQSL